jgi:proteasome accessory factor C
VEKLDRIQQLHRILKARRRPVTLRQLAEEMDCTPRTVKRDIEYLQDVLRVPIEFDGKSKGWRFVSGAMDVHELPGLWLTSEELQSLALLLHTLENFGNGVLNSELGTVERQIHKLMESRGIAPSAFARHVRVLPLGNRKVTGASFQIIGEALLKHTQLRMRYTDYNQRKTTRTVSPQTLVYYRDNWYLDAWCHRQQALRTFSLARIDACRAETEAAVEMPRETLDAHFSKSYGMFAGEPTGTATLRFLPGIAREIAMQQWHPEQVGRWDGRDYLLSFPYSKPHELVGDILRYVPNVIVDGPVELREMVGQRLQEGMELYK